MIGQSPFNDPQMTQEELQEQNDRVSLVGMSREETMVWINSAPTPEEKNRRKSMTFPHMYSRSEKFNDFLKGR